MTRVGHYETQTVSEAYDEPVYESVNVCSVCGASFSSAADISAHIAADHEGAATYRSEQVQTGTIHHDAVTQEVWVVDEEAYDEEVVSGYQCSCGATQ